MMTTNIKENDFLKALNLPVYNESSFKKSLVNNITKDERETGIFIDANVYMSLKTQGLDKTHILETMLANRMANGSWVFVAPGKMALCVSQNKSQQLRAKRGEYVCISNAYYDVACVINK